MRDQSMRAVARQFGIRDDAPESVDHESAQRHLKAMAVLRSWGKERDYKADDYVAAMAEIDDVDETVDRRLDRPDPGDVRLHVAALRVLAEHDKLREHTATEYGAALDEAERRLRADAVVRPVQTRTQRADIAALKRRVNALERKFASAG